LFKIYLQSVDLDPVPLSMAAFQSATLWPRFNLQLSGIRRGGRTNLLASIPVVAA
jgi:hypothetical protein